MPYTHLPYLQRHPSHLCPLQHTHLTSHPPKPRTPASATQCHASANDQEKHKMFPSIPAYQSMRFHPLNSRFKKKLTVFVPPASREARKLGTVNFLHLPPKSLTVKAINFSDRPQTNAQPISTINWCQHLSRGTPGANMLDLFAPERSVSEE